MEHLEDNKLIAEFQGHKIDYGYNKDGVLFFGAHIKLNELKYHSSWDWLMPVVEKIESLGYVFFISGLKIEYYLKKEYSNKSQNFYWPGSKLEATYAAVIFFINKYNGKTYRG